MKYNPVVITVLSLALISFCSSARHLSKGEITQTNSPFLKEFGADSEGCKNKRPKGMTPGKVIEKQIDIEDPKLGKISRKYTIALPDNYDQKTAAPLVLRIHGQGGEYPYPVFHNRMKAHGYIVVEPKGMDDHESKVIAWNDGINDKGQEVGSKTCFKDTLIGRCYDSCKKLDSFCTPCSYATCYDDGLFIQKLTEFIKSEYCVNLSRVYASGQSNGAMMIYYLVKRFPEMFNAVVPYFGISLVGLGDTPSNAKNIDILHFHDRSDQCIPQLGVSSDGWIFESVESTHERWAREQECKLEMGLKDFKTPYDGGDRNVSCVRKEGCIGDIIRCLYDGQHGDNPKKAIPLTLWFYDRSYKNRQKIANSIKKETQ